MSGSSNVEKSPAQCLQLLFSKLNYIFSSLLSEYFGDIIYKNKMLNAVEGIDAGKIPYKKPVDTVQGIIGNLYTSLDTIKRHSIDAIINTRKISAEPRAYHVDRRFVRPKFW